MHDVSPELALVDDALAERERGRLPEPDDCLAPRATPISTDPPAPTLALLCAAESLPGSTRRCAARSGEPPAAWPRRLPALVLAEPPAETAPAVPEVLPVEEPVEPEPLLQPLDEPEVALAPVPVEDADTPSEELEGAPEEAAPPVGDRDARVGRVGRSAEEPSSPLTFTP